MQRKIKRSDRIVRVAVDFTEPVVHRTFVVPALSDTEGVKVVHRFFQIAQLGDRLHHPRRIAFDEIETEAVEANGFDHPLSQLNQRRINHGIAMAKVRHLAEGHLVENLKWRGMEARPVARELTAGRSELGPAGLAVNGVE